LEALGFNLELGPDQVVEMINATGFGFFFAPRFHPAMRHAVPVRKELGVRTVFNFLGPLCNPARARMAVGTSDPRMARLMIDVLKARGIDRGFVVYGEEGLDELSISGPSRVYRLLDDEVTEAEFTPEDFGVDRAGIDQILGGDAETNLEITRSVLAGVKGAHRDVVIVNASPALVLAGIADGFVSGVELATRAIDDGRAADVLERSLEMSKRV
jgi:anthranilate phosphoribosyltransferase